MITLVIYGVIAIALASAAGYAFISFSSSSRQLTQLQENQVRMDTAVAGLRASLLALSGDGVSYAPDGIAGATYMQLPTQLGVVSAAPWGQPYEYCPVSQTGSSAHVTATGTDTVQSVSSSYSVGVLSNTLTQGNNYVVTSSQPSNINATNAPGYVAFIVSALGPGQTMPACSAILVNGNGLSVSGGTVRGVTAGFSFLQRNVAASDRMEIYVGSAVTGDGTGRDKSNLIKIDGAMALWSALQPRLGMIYLENSVTVTSTANFTPLDPAGMDIQAQNASLVIETDPSIASSGNVTITFPGGITLPVATAFQNVNIGGATSIVAYKPLKFRNVTLTGATAISAYSADVTISDSGFSNTTLYASNSRVSFANYKTTGTTFAGVITANLSNISFESAVSGQAATYTLSPGGTTTAISGTASNVTIGASNGASTGVTVNGQIALTAGNLYVNANSTLTSTLSTASPIYVANGSVSIAGTLAATSTSAAVQAVGSHIYISNLLNASSGTSGAILATASSITGVGTIKTNSALNPCVDFYSTSGALVPIYINAADSTAGGYPGYAYFLGLAQYGYPPLLTYTTGTYDTTTVAAGLTQNTTLGTDPYIPPVTVTAGVTQAGYLDKTSFEAGVRSIVNQELRPGLDMYFTGTCGP